MSDHEITQLCAMAIGLTPYRAVHGGVIQNCSDSGIYVVSENDASGRGYSEYDPLRNDAYTMELVRKLNLNIMASDSNGWWEVFGCNGVAACSGKELNRAICEFVASEQAEKVRK